LGGGGGGGDANMLMPCEYAVLPLIA
jgi:hypothetical protein